PGRVGSLTRGTVLLQPRHLDRLELSFARELRVVGKARELGHPPVEVRKAHGERVRTGKLLRQRDADLLGVPPRQAHGRYSTISTITSPCTIAWHPRRERSVRPWAVSRRSSSPSSMGDRLPSPSFTTTWHVVHAQLPPQLCSRRTAWWRAMSRSEPARP